MRSQTILFCVLLTILLPSTVRGEEVLVSAAASLTDAMKEIGTAFTKEYRGTTVRFNFGASGALQRQIEQGAPVDVFAPASSREMDALVKSHNIEGVTRVDFASNRLVLIAPTNSRLKRWEDLAGSTVRRVALSNPDSVPSGRYAKETLTRRKLWNSVQGKAVFGENVRQTLTYVASGDVDAGIVFSTDARDEKRVRVIQETLPGKDHTPIVYPAAVVAHAPNGSAARRFVVFLQGHAAQAILAKYGFTSLRPAPIKPTRNLNPHASR
jgi:molybdate transport system substrate-binding protein